MPALVHKLHISIADIKRCAGLNNINFPIQLYSKFIIH
jgi:hypothetical protein